MYSPPSPEASTPSPLDESILSQSSRVSDHVHPFLGHHDMRTILFLAVLLAAPAQAEVIARAQNEGGGQIVLTDEPCPKIKNAYRIITYSDAGTIRGCWGRSSMISHESWSSGKGTPPLEPTESTSSTRQASSHYNSIGNEVA